MNEINLKNEAWWKGAEFWSNEIKNAGVYDKLPHFNDVIVEKRPPHSERYHLVLNDIVLDGKPCDIYHTDQEDESGNTIGVSYHRIFIYVKD